MADLIQISLEETGNFLLIQMLLLQFQTDIYK
jgi:hypothetical protein